MALSLSEITSNPIARKRKVDDRTCKYCVQLFAPHTNASEKRDWCYEWKCEGKREVERTGKIAEANRLRKIRLSQKTE